MVMNEQIKQLAEQAGFVLWKDENWNPGDIVDWSARYDDELKKFAELIVRECCVALHPMLRDMISRGQGVELIKQHFGVEE
jgi:hypothetical protein